MLLEKDFLILDAINRYQPSSQRALANLCGMSLGRTNYGVKKLVERGLVKISRVKDSSSKNRHAYLLTAQGLRYKGQMSTPFLKARMRDFEDFRNRLLENLLELQDQGIDRLLILGSRSLGKLLEHIARMENLHLRIVGTASEADHFGCFARDAYDRILITEDPAVFGKLILGKQIPEDKVAYLK